MEEQEKELHISVRNLVEFIFREGDIDNRGGKIQSADAMMEGTRIHRMIQKEMGAEYMSEVPLSISLSEELYRLVIEGRADGIYTTSSEDFLARKYNRDSFYMQESLFELPQRTFEEEAEILSECKELTVIDEIKGVYRNVEAMVEPVYVHKAQAMVYGYIMAYQNQFSHIGIQMTYCNLDNREVHRFYEVYTFEEIETWFMELVTSYKRWADFQFEWKKKRQESIQTLDFPFAYREGQKQLVTDVYRTILRQKNLFLQAPTGVGKTISTVYPAVRAVGANLADRIFYLTAKTITGSVAKEAFQTLYQNGYKAKVIQLTAKEKLCMCEQMECNPIDCPYAKGHFDRVNDAVYDLLKKRDLFTREDFIHQAEEYTVCPFELSLDVSTWCDDIICDYNYVFDPRVYLKRFFQEGIKGDYIFLVDEAHNLVDRSREMYSAVLYKEDVLNAKKLLKDHHRGLEKLLDRCNKQMLEYKRECSDYRVYDNLGSILLTLTNIASMLDELLQKPFEVPGRKEIVDFYFEVRNFLDIYNLVDENYVIYSQVQEDGRFMLKLFCVDPSKNLQRCLDKGKSTIFFSATLLPIQYYKNLLSTKEDNYAVYAKSTFDASQYLLLFGNDVSTKYTRRNKNEYARVAEYIHKTVACKKGNYMAFFPSYQFMQNVYEEFESSMKNPVEVVVQANTMTEEERELFLQAFDKERETSLVAFCVMGGIFGEGIDLKNDRLIGAIVVGTGLPQISDEREILKNYYDEKYRMGFDYAFRYPGMNKVLQAAGRVIRTTEDLGVILLLDERFLQSDYKNLYPREWLYPQITDVTNVEQEINAFWSKTNNNAN